jgi:hypothetical protein
MFNQGAKMLTKLDLCSMALLKLGEKPIQSLSDDSATSQLARTLFDVVINSLLTSHPWRFATQDIKLTKNTDGEFLIPSNVLRILKSNARICGDRILSDQDEVLIVAIVRTEPSQFPGYFVSLAASRLAIEFCIPLLGDQTVFRMLVSIFETELQSAKFIDSTTSMPEAISGFSLVDSRF